MRDGASRFVMGQGVPEPPSLSPCPHPRRIFSAVAAAGSAKRVPPLAMPPPNTVDAAAVAVTADDHVAITPCSARSRDHDTVWLDPSDAERLKQSGRRSKRRGNRRRSSPRPVAVPDNQSESGRSDSSGASFMSASAEPTRVKTFFEWQVVRDQRGNLVHAKREVKALTALPVEKELQKQSLYRTELCQFYERDNVCPFGDRCLFAHGVENLRAVLRHPKYKTKVCKQFQQTGHCQYGVRCRFIHDLDANSLPGKPVPDRDPLPSASAHGAKPAAAAARVGKAAPLRKTRRGGVGKQAKQTTVAPAPRQETTTPQPLPWTQAQPLLITKMTTKTPPMPVISSRLPFFRQIAS